MPKPIYDPGRRTREPPRKGAINVPKAAERSASMQREEWPSEMATWGSTVPDEQFQGHGGGGQVKRKQHGAHRALFTYVSQ